MSDVKKQRREMIEGQPVLIVVDIQKGAFLKDVTQPIPFMEGYAERMAKARIVVDAARAADIPIIFIAEVHRRTMVDFGRELDGDEDIHCLEDDAATKVAADELGLRPDDYVIAKRRYSAFFGTDLEILLKGLKASTLILVGGLTNVCVHYTFVDGHQHDYFCRVVEDCVGGSSIEAHDASLNAMEYLQNGARRQSEEIVEGFARFASGKATLSIAS